MRRTVNGRAKGKTSPIGPLAAPVGTFSRCKLEKWKKLFLVVLLLINLHGTLQDLPHHSTTIWVWVKTQQVPHRLETAK